MASKPDRDELNRLARQIGAVETKLEDDAAELRALTYRYDSRAREVKKLKDEMAAVRAALSQGSREGR